MALKDETRHPYPDMQSRCQTKKLSQENTVFERELSQWDTTKICKKHSLERLCFRGNWESNGQFEMQWKNQEECFKHIILTCEKMSTFNQNLAFNLHQILNTGKKPSDFKECGKAFCSGSDCFQHQSIHTDEKFSEGDECAKTS